MELDDLIKNLKLILPNDTLDIKASLELLSESIGSTYTDIQSEQNAAFSAHDFQRMGFLPQLAIKVAEVQDFINSLAEKLDIENDGAETDNKSEDEIPKEQNTSAIDYSKYVVDQQIPHNLYENFTHKTPAAFSLFGERTKATHWKDALLLTCEVLAKKDFERFKNAALDETMQGRKIKYFAEEPNDMRSPEKMKSTDIYVETNLSANHVRNILAKLLRLFGLKISDYIIFLKADYSPLHE